MGIELCPEIAQLEKSAFFPEVFYLALFVERFADEEHGDAQAHINGYPPIDPDDSKGFEGDPGLLLGIELKLTDQGVQTKDKELDDEEGTDAQKPGENAAAVIQEQGAGETGIEEIKGEDEAASHDGDDTTGPVGSQHRDAIGHRA
jgi:hypothetical protein